MCVKMVVGGQMRVMLVQQSEGRAMIIRLASLESLICWEERDIMPFSFCLFE